MKLRARIVVSATLAVVGPLLLALAWLRLIGVPFLPLAIAACALVLLVVAADGYLLAQRRFRLALLALSTHGALALLLLGHRAAPLPAPVTLELPLPRAAPPESMTLHALPTGLLHRTAAFGYRGGSPLELRDFAMTAVLVKHPRGDLLIDTGFGDEIRSQLKLMPLGFRALTSLDLALSARAQLEVAHYDRTQLKAILLTHAHWDHASGVDDFPGVPVWVTREEHDFIEHGGFITAVARSALEAHYVDYELDDSPYLGFERSRDVYGDGAIVIVPSPGHTPGSVIIFVTLPGEKRYAFIGDLAWQLEGVAEREERPWPMRNADSDAAAVREGLRHMAALSARFPEMVIVPAHDARAMAALPRL